MPLYPHRAHSLATNTKHCSDIECIGLMGRDSKADREAVPVLLEAYDGDRAAVARQLGRDVRFVKRWEERVEAGQGTGNQPGQGRKRKLTGAATSAAKRMATGRTKISSGTVAKRLYDSGKTSELVSPSTVQRALHSGRVPIVWKSTIRHHRLTPRHEGIRLKWCREHLDVDWTRVMPNDSHLIILGRHKGYKRYQNPRRRTVTETQHHGMSIHLYVGATVHGITACHFVSGTSGLKTGTKGVGSVEYQSVIEKTLVPEGRRMFNGQPFIIYQDGASAHTAASSMRKWASYGDEITVLQAPPLSPDLNWVENIWSVLDDKLMGKTYKTITSFKTAIQKAISEIPPDFCRKQVESMRGRLLKVIENKGGHIERTIYT